MGSFLARAAGLGANPAVANADKLDGIDASALQRDATTRISTEMDGTTGAQGVEIDWVSLPFTQPAGRTLVGYVGEATVTVPLTCSGGRAQVHLYLNGESWGASEVVWSPANADTSVTAGLAFQGQITSSLTYHAYPARSSDVLHTLTLTVEDQCGDTSNWTFTSLIVDVILL